jgi:outer membrane cobalamin receptor
MSTVRALLLSLALLRAAPLLGQPTPAAFVAVDRVRWARLDSLRTSEARRTTRAVALSELVTLAGGTVTYESSLGGLDDSVSLIAPLTLRKAFARVVDGSAWQILADPVSAAFVVRRASSPIRRVRVIDAATRAPVVGAEVLVPRFSRSVRAGGGGIAVLGDLGTGPIAVVVRALGYAPQSDTVPPAVEKLVALAPSPPSLREVVVTPGSSRAFESSLAAVQAVTREDAAARPQVGEDLFRAINRLPGVTTSDFSAAFNVRGARADEVLVMLDGMQLREPYHLRDIGSGLSILDQNATGSVELVPGSFTSEFGDRLTGVLSITPREAASGERLWSAGLSATWIRALAGGRTDDGRWSWMASARRGYLDLVFDLTNADAEFSVQYADAFVRGSWRPTSHDVFSTTILGSTDRLSQTAQFDTPPFGSRYRSRYGWFSWQHASDRLSGQTTLGRSSTIRDRRASGGTTRASAGRIADARTIDVTHLRTSWTIVASERLVVRAGGELQPQSARYLYDRIRPSQATLSGFETRTDSLVVGIDTTGLWSGGWIAPRWQVGRVVAEAGVRADRWNWSGPLTWQPRFNLSWAINPRTTLRGAVGRFAQSQGLEALQVEQGLRAWDPPERAIHTGIGVDRDIVRGVHLRVDGYQRALSPVRSRFLNLGGALDITTDLRFSNRMISAEKGRARGVEVSLSGDAGRRIEWSGWYAISEIADRIAGRWTPRSIDQRHAGAIDISWRTRDRRWRSSVAVVLRSGWPYTPLTVVVDTFRVGNTRRFLARTEFGAYNGARLPTYARIDWRLLRRYQTRHGQWSAFLDLFNLTGRFNPMAYEAQVRSAQPLVWSSQPVEWVPRIPTFGVSWER